MFNFFTLFITISTTYFLVQSLPLLSNIPRLILCLAGISLLIYKIIIRRYNFKLFWLLGLVFSYLKIFRTPLAIFEFFLSVENVKGIRMISARVTKWGRVITPILSIFCIHCSSSYFFSFTNRPDSALFLAASRISTTIILFSIEYKSKGANVISFFTTAASRANGSL